MCISNLGNRRPFATTAMRMLQQLEQEHQSSLLFKELVRASRTTISEDSSSAEQVESEHVQQHQSQALHHHITVQHHYHDHANDNAADYQEEHPVRGGVTTPFPLKLHEMLDAAAAEGMDHIVSWQPHGRCFLVHKPKEFVAMLPRYFKLSKLASFQRQLNLYGFQRLTRGRDRGGYYHELFLRDRVFLSHSIQRIKVKGTGVRARSNPDQEPELWAMPWVTTTSTSITTTDKHSNQQQPQTNAQVDEDFLGESDVCYSDVPSMEQSLCMDKTMSQVPLHLMMNPPPVPVSGINMISMMIPSTVFQTEGDDDDDVLDAFSKSFHYLDPFQPSAGNWSIQGVDALLQKEADTFFQDFEFPEEQVDSANVEDDAVFGDLLEQMIA